MYGELAMFQGSIVALVTPLKNNQIDFERLQTLIMRHIDAGTHGIVVAGTTGESGTLTHAEKVALVKKTVDLVQNRIPVIAGISVNSTQEAIESAKDMMELGVDGLLVMTPAYIKPTQEGLYRHYSQIAHAIPLPIILYNVPSRTGVDLLPETVARLAEISNIVGIKEATGQMSRLQQLLKQCEHRIDILSGDDTTCAAWMVAGAKGVISVTANVVPQEMAKLCESALDGDHAACLRIQQTLNEMHHMLFVETNPIPVKWALHRLGLMSDEIRLPMTILSSGHHQALEKLMQQLNLY
jgi:4-hydroxy-tetrahydrodipicolinate synthase